MRRVSQKQAQKNRELARIKSELPPVCTICGKYGTDLAHLLPKSIYPEYYTEKWNLVMMCRSCHVRYDDNRHFRSGQILLFLQVAEHDEKSAKRHFDSDIHTSRESEVWD